MRKRYLFLVAYHKPNLHSSADGLCTLGVPTFWVSPCALRPRINTVQSHCGAHKLSAELAKLAWFVGLGFIFVRCRFNKENENAVIQKYCTVAHRHFMIAAEYCSWRIRGSAADWSSRSSFFFFFIVRFASHPPLAHPTSIARCRQQVSV